MENEVKKPYRYHLAIKQNSFDEFREFKRIGNFLSDDLFCQELLRIYKLYLKQKERKNVANNMPQV